MPTPTLRVTSLLSFIFKIAVFLSRLHLVTPPSVPSTQPFYPPISSTLSSRLSHPPGTLLHEALVRFAFDVMASGKETCNKQDVMELVSLLHADVGRVKETTATLMGIMDPHNRNKISFDTFRYEGVKKGREGGGRSRHRCTHSTSLALWRLPHPSIYDFFFVCVCVCVCVVFLG